MGEYAAIEKEAKLFTELCVHNDAIDPNLCRTPKRRCA